MHEGRYLSRQRNVKQCLVLSAAMFMMPSIDLRAAEPGDYGYHHEYYHRRGLIDELARRTGRSCCDEIGECRATYVRLREREVYLEGRWCEIGHDVPVRTDIPLPDEFALVCAGRSAWPHLPCPFVYCIAVAPGF
jgi:hypothetical protein